MKIKLYFTPPQIELFCISVSRMYNNTKDVTTEITPFASLRLCVFALYGGKRKGAKARKNKSAVYAGVEYNHAIFVHPRNSW